MRPLVDMDTIQIEITNQCVNRCSNCTRLCGHHPKPYFMSFEQFKDAVDSMQHYPKMTGMMGGEPLLHPEFKKFCEYLHSKISPQKCGLWTCFPKGYEKYREIICKTFGHIFLNDHSRDDILHGPILVASEEITLPEKQKDYMINDCWIQKYWSAAINPHGAFFCEVAAALSLLLESKEESLAWTVKDRWWTVVPKDYVEQMERYCKLCGCAMPLKKRASSEGIDDISPKMLDRIKRFSPKIKQGKYAVHKLELVQDNRPTALYKEANYRAEIADRYGIFLMLNPMGFQTPHLKSNWEAK